ncbi:MAG: 4-vinyl reductase [Anaerolineales bacterium]|nr:4-vinyl reductase [Anaerolineales bacterium]MCS7249113.1 4-vinyl reductase [Anaerolineales bacterium]MDW8162926.1 4-vinyl reductase [Anaerolineales bacterium]MDW8446329.1 4-vinyl reductase [Anaerolineales bacterium]
MEPIPKSGYYYANKFALITLKALEEVMGKNGINAILNLAHLSHLIDHYPPDNLERQFDFADFSALNWALEEMYGPRGGRGLALRAGRATFADALRNFGALAGVGDLAFKVLPLEIKLRIGLPAMAKIFSQFTDQHTTVQEYENEFVYTIHRCPVCWGRSGVDKPVCYIATGLLQESLKWVSGGLEFRVAETKCIAMGDPTCDFVIPKKPIE